MATVPKFEKAQEDIRREKYGYGGRYYLHYYYSDYPKAESFARTLDAWNSENVFENQIKIIKERKTQIASRMGLSKTEGEKFWNDLYQTTAANLAENFNEAISGGIYEYMNGDQAVSVYYANEMLIGKTVNDLGSIVKRTSNINSNLDKFVPVLNQFVEAIIPDANDRKLLSQAIFNLAVLRSANGNEKEQSALSRDFLQKFMTSKDSEKDKLYRIDDSATSSLDEITKKKLKSLTNLQTKVIALATALESMAGGGVRFDFSDGEYYFYKKKDKFQITSETLEKALRSFFTNCKTYGSNVGKASHEVASAVAENMSKGVVAKHVKQVTDNIQNAPIYGDEYTKLVMNAKNDSFFEEALSAAGANLYLTRKSKPDNSIYIEVKGSNGIVRTSLGVSVKQSGNLFNIMDASGNYTGVNKGIQVKLQDSTSLLVLLIRELGMNENELEGLYNLAVGKGDDERTNAMSRKIEYSKAELNVSWNSFISYIQKKLLLPSLTGILYGNNFSYADPSAANNGEAYFMIINNKLIQVEDIIRMAMGSGNVNILLNKKTIPTRSSLSAMNEWVGDKGSLNTEDSITRSENLFKDVSSALYKAKMTIKLSILKKQVSLLGL